MTPSVLVAFAGVAFLGAVGFVFVWVASSQMVRRPPQTPAQLEFPMVREGPDEGQGTLRG